RASAWRGPSHPRRSTASTACRTSLRCSPSAAHPNDEWERPCRTSGDNTGLRGTLAMRGRYEREGVMILVAGATGNVRASAVAELTAKGLPVRAFVRDEGRAKERLGGDVQMAVGD